MSRTLAARIAGAVLATGAAGAIALAGAGAANAQSYSSTPLAPGQGVCSSAQYASYQVRADGWATGRGAKFKLLRNGVVISNTPGRATQWAAAYRTAFGTFPGAGYYSMCAQNTGTTNTTVTLQLRTDAEF